MGKKIARLACLLLAAALVSCGGGTNVNPFNLNPSGFLKASSVSAGGFHTCAVLADGTVNCWGLNSSGQLGNGNNANFFKPVLVTGISTATRVSSGGSHTCALLTDGSIRCWGLNNFGQLGNGTTVSSNVPVRVSNIGNAVSVFAGENHTCAILSDGTVSCWGDNAAGQLGNGTTGPTSTPVQSTLPTGVVSIAAGGRHTCAIINDGTVRCWGSNNFGQLGVIGTIASATPVAVPGVGGVTALAAGASHTCAALSTGTASCWGDNSTGQIGNRWTTITLIPPVVLTSSDVPLAVNQLTSVGQGISAGQAHSCALTTDGTVKCWGDGSQNQIGSGSQVGFIPPGAGVPESTFIPITVSLLSSAASVSSGHFHSCSLRSDHTVLCWGLNSTGQLGNGNNFVELNPVEVIQG